MQHDHGSRGRREPVESGRQRPELGRRHRQLVPLPRRLAGASRGTEPIERVHHLTRRRADRDGPIEQGEGRGSRRRPIRNRPRVRLDTSPSTELVGNRRSIPRRSEQLFGLEPFDGGADVRLEHHRVHSGDLGQTGHHGVDRRRSAEHTPYVGCAAVQHMSPSRRRVIEDQRAVDGDDPHVRSGHHRIFTWQGVPHGSTSWQHGRVHLLNGRKQQRGGAVHDL